MLARYGEPSREHWESDHSRTTCAASDCSNQLRMGARHHCRRCGKIFCDQCSGGGYIRRLNAKAEYTAKGVMSVVCRSCFYEGNGWFAEHGSAEWGEASKGHTADRMSDFDRERKVGQAHRKAIMREESSKQYTPAWRLRMLQSIIGYLIDEYAAAAPGGGGDAVGRAARVTRGLTGGGGGGKSREHWVQDRNIMLCQQPSCRRAFTLNERKHHCRVCGKVFCDNCSPKRLNIIEYAFEHASEEQLPLLDALRVADDEPRRERACMDCYGEVFAETNRHANRRKLEGAGAHVLSNLYEPIPEYVQAICVLLRRLESAISYLRRLTDLSEAGEEAEEMRHVVAADVLEVKGELIETFRRYEERYNKILKWGGWRYATILAEGTPVTARDGTVTPNLFIWQDRVCCHKTLQEGTCAIVADALDPVRPGEVFFEGQAQVNVEEQLRVLNSLKLHFSGFWRERYNAEFKALVDDANRAIAEAASAPQQNLNPRPSKPLPPTPPTAPAAAAAASPALMTPQGHETQQVTSGAAAPSASLAPDTPAEIPVVGPGGAAGHVLVHIIEAAELDLCGVPAKKISAYAVVGCGGRTCATHVSRKTAHPRWEQKFALTVSSIEEDLINLVVYSKKIELGSWTFGVSELVHEMGGNMQGWVVLCPPANTNQDIDQGRIRISVKYMPSVTADEGPAFVKVNEVNLLVDDTEESQGAVASVVERPSKVVNVATGEADDATVATSSVLKGGGGGGVENIGVGKGASDEEEVIVKEPAEQVEALSDAYVSTYTLFDEVKKWQGQLDVAMVLSEESQKKLLSGLTVLLERVGSHLQERVAAAGGEWRSHRGTVLQLIKARSEGGAVIYPQRERVRQISGGAAGIGMALKGVDLLERVDAVLMEAGEVIRLGGCGGRGKAFQGVVECREKIRKLALMTAIASPKGGSSS